jgi:predicted GNAT family acetyltransferase
MAITKRTEEDKIEVVGPYKSIQVRTATVIEEDGVELSRSFHRHVLQCVSSVKNDDDTWTHTDTDVSEESTEVQGIATAVWTDAIKEAKRTANENSGI